MMNVRLDFVPLTLAEMPGTDHSKKPLTACRFSCPPRMPPSAVLIVLNTLHCAVELEGSDLLLTVWKEGQLRCFLHHTKLTRAVCRTKKQRSPSKAVLKIANEKRTGLSSDEVEPDAKILSVDVSFKKVVQICRGPLLVDPSASVTLTPTLNSRHRPTHGAKPRHGTLEMQESRSDKGTPLCQSLKQNRGSGWARCWGKIGDGA